MSAVEGNILCNGNGDLIKKAQYQINDTGLNMIFSLSRLYESYCTPRALSVSTSN